MAPANRKDPKRADSSESSYSLMEFMRDFPDDETCLNWLWLTRYATDDEGTEAQCERCEEIRVFKRYDTKQQRQSWTCTACGLNVHPTAGTIFHKSSTSLHLWFYAMYMMTSTRCGISAKQLERELGVTYKTAWRMFTLIRNELMGPEDVTLSREVEMDETYIGGKPRQSDKAAWAREAAGAWNEKHVRQSLAQKWSAEHKTAVFGMAQRNGARLPDQKARGGKVVAVVVPSVQAATLRAEMANHVEPGTKLYTDDAPVYRRLRLEGWKHEAVNHSERVYVSGDIHTQTIEGFWSLVKRGIDGTHHAVSAKWLQGYVNEYVWRYNHRGDGRAMFATLLFRSAFPVAR